VGVRPVDTAYIAFGYGSFIGFLGLHYAMEKYGACSTCPAARRPTENAGQADPRLGATVVASTPTYALRLAQEAEIQGTGPARLRRGQALILSASRRVSISADQGADRGAVGKRRAFDTGRH